MSSRQSPEAMPRKTSEPIENLHNSLPFLLRITHRQLARALEEALKARGLTSGYWYFLRVLWTQEGMTQAELSAQVGVMTPAAVPALNALERRKLIERRTDTNDRRKIRVHLTPQGRALEKELMPIAQDVLSKALQGITREDLRIFRNVLQRLRANSRTLA